MRKIKKKTIKETKQKQTTYLKEDKLVNEYYKPLRKVTLLLDIMKFHTAEHRVLWDNKDTYIKGWLKSILTSTVKEITAFNEKYGEEELIQEKRDGTRETIEKLVDVSSVKTILNEYTHQQIDINYALFISMSYLVMSRNTLRLSFNGLSNKHREAKKHLDRIINQIDIYIRWWRKEIDCKLLDMLK